MEIIEQDVMGVSFKIRFYLYALAKSVRMVFSQALTFYLNMRKLCLKVTNQHNSSLCLLLGEQAVMFKLSDSPGFPWFKSGGKQKTFLEKVVLLIKRDQHAQKYRGWHIISTEEKVSCYVHSHFGSYCYL